MKVDELPAIPVAMGYLIGLDTRRPRCSVCHQPMVDVQAGRHMDRRLDPPMPGGTWFCDLKLELLKIQEVVAELRINASRAAQHGEVAVAASQPRAGAG